VEFQEKTILGEFFENFVQTKAIYLLPKLVKFCPTLCNFYSGSILQKVERNFTSFGRGYSLGLYKISEKFSQNSFFLKFHVRISTEFGTKRDKFQVKRMSIRPRKKSNSFTHKRSFLLALAVINKIFIVNLVGQIWASNLTQNSIDTVTNVW